MNKVEIKHKHHYVFKAYLKSWSSNEQIWCCRKDKAFLTNINNVAQERDLYKIKELNSEEEKFINFFLYNQPQEVKDTVINHIQLLRKPIKWKAFSDLLIELTNNYSHNSIKLSSELNEALDNLNRIAKSGVNNLVEDVYSEDEGKAIVYLKQIMDENLNFFYNPTPDESYLDSKQRFIQFICVQHFRTKSARVRWEKGMRESFDKEILRKLGIDYDKLRPDHLSYYVFWYTENHVADMLYYEKAHLTLIVNNTKEPFITSDQPVINLKANYQSINDAPTDLIFYYPISPNYAIMLNDNNTESKIIATENDVEYYNSKILQSSFENIFANDKSLFKKYHY